MNELQSTLLVESHRTSLLENVHITIHYHSPEEYLHHVRIVLSPCANGHHYGLQTLLVSVQSGMITSDQDVVEFCNSLLQSKGFVFLS